MTRVPTWFVGLVLWGAFPIVWWAVPPTELFELLNGAIVSLATGIMVAYRRRILEVLRLPVSRLMGSDALNLAVFQTSLATVGVFLCLFVWRLSGHSDPSSELWIWAFTRWVMLTSMALFMISSDTIDDRMPPRNYIVTGWLVAIGMGIAVIVLSWANNGSSWISPLI